MTNFAFATEATPFLLLVYGNSLEFFQINNWKKVKLKMGMVKYIVMHCDFRMLGNICA